MSSSVESAVADVLDVARFTPGVGAVDVDIGERFLERIERMLCVILRAEQPGFLRGRRHE